MRACTLCNKVKVENEFGAPKFDKRSGRYYNRSWCKECANLKAKGYHKMNPKAKKDWKRKNKDKVKQYPANKRVARITDSYCRELLRCAKGTVSQKLIEQKRLSIKLKRKLYEIKRQIKPSGSDGRPHVLLPGIDRD